MIDERKILLHNAEMGYGKFLQSGIPGGSTLIFEVDLIGIA